MPSRWPNKTWNLLDPFLKSKGIFLRTEGSLVSDQFDYNSSGNTIIVDLLINKKEIAKLILIEVFLMLC